MILQVQTYLRSGKTLQDLNSELGINARRHSKLPNLVSLKYNQLESPRNHPVVMECRGLILDEANDWDIVAFPFKRFFNADEGFAADIDWSTAKVQEKVDGSLIILYYYAGQWHVATSGSADAGGSVGDGLEWRENGIRILPHPESFAQYFWQTATKCYGPDFHLDAKTDHCYMLELTGPLNRIVVYHEKASLTVLGARRLSDLQEISAKEAASHLRGVPAVKEFDLSSVGEIVATFEDISPLSQEGYVAHDAVFNRIKVKSPGYVAIHHAKDGLTTKAFVEIARSGEVFEVVAHFPEYQPPLEEAKERFQSLLQELQQEYEGIKHIQNQKEFALQAVKSRCSGALFAYRAGKVSSIGEFLKSMHIDKMMKLLGYKNE